MSISAEFISNCLGGSRSGNGYQARCPSHDDRTPSLSITERDGTILVKCHAGCSQESVIAALRHKGLWPDKAESFQFDSVASARSKWNSAIVLENPRAELAKIYFQSRGLELTNPWPESIMFMPRLGYYANGKKLGEFPALIGKIVNIHGDLIGIQRIFLNPNGKKLNPLVEFPDHDDKIKLSAKKVLGNAKGGAIHLDEPTQLLCVGEGLETTLAIRQATKLPCWSAVSAGGIENLEIPSTVKELRIWMDVEPSGTGKRAAFELALRCSVLGIKCFLHDPSAVRP